MCTIYIYQRPLYISIVVIQYICNYYPTHLQLLSVTSPMTIIQYIYTNNYYSIYSYQQLLFNTYNNYYLTHYNNYHRQLLLLFSKFT